ncbi:MAG: [protein-PII] uridylyltransferase [Sandaracinaceae bacterium]|nr:[protein-PII] uridylyltransferase [Sandaracinaceae bacterium]
MVSAQSRTIDLGRLAPTLSATCDEYLQSYRTSLENTARAGRAGVSLSREHSRILDGLLSALFCASDAASRQQGRSTKGRVALVAVGGWGRARVGLRSDIDALFLCDDPSDPHIASLAEGVLYPLWDLGVTVGHVVRGVKETLELARTDMPTATTLVDLRRVAGDGSIVDELVKGSRRSVFEPALDTFLDAMTDDTIARHERFGGSLYLLEPDVKLGRGGLRDLDVALWSARARWGAGTLGELVERGALHAREAFDMEAAEEFLWCVRNRLHLKAARRQDRLSFEDQEELATAFGFADGETLGVEQFMQTYYRYARTVAQMSERLVERARPKRKRLFASSRLDVGHGLVVCEEHIALKNVDELASDPCLALRFYDEVVSRELPPHSASREAIMHAAVDPQWCVRLRESAESAPIFLRLLTHVGDVPVRRGSILSELHETGLLLAMIPEFESVTGRVQHDVYHVYTVDVHSVAAVDRLRSITRGEIVNELPLPCSLATDAVRPVPLFLAVLLHDIGKARGKDHSQKGAEMAQQIAPRLGLSPLDVEHVVWLICEHLSLYHWAMRRDTSDPETIADVARLVGSADRLRDLYLLTVADLSTTNPKAMTSWKARMLDDLYVSVVAALDGDATIDAHERAALLRESLRPQLAGGSDGVALCGFLDAMPARYLLANTPDAIRNHANVAVARGEKLVHIAASLAASGDVELVVLTDDKAGLLADITAALTANRLGVSAAQIYTRPRRDGVAEAFDVFQVRRVGRVSPDDLAWMPKLEADLSAILSGAITASALLAARPRPPAWASRKGPAVRTEVRVDNGVSPRFTVVDVYTRDRVGLLHAIARTLHEQGLTIALSKVNTEGLRVADVFYVTDAAGMKLSDPARLTELPIALRETIALLDAEGAVAELEGESA